MIYAIHLDVQDNDISFPSGTFGNIRSNFLSPQRDIYLICPFLGW